MAALHPMHGIRVVDFGQGAAGPLAATMLADMGAEVVKVESRKRLDSVRSSPDNIERDPEKDPWFHNNNRNKLGLTVDFSDDRGVAVLRNLIKISDVVLENFSPGTMKRHGLDYETLAGIKHDLIMVSFPGAGSHGPLSDLVSYGPSISGLCGYDSLVGYPGERLLGVQVPYPDFVGALHGAIAVLVALSYRDQIGEGQHVEVSQLESAESIMGEAIAEYIMAGRIMGLQGNRRAGMAPHNNYPCQGDDKWVSIAVGADDQWDKFCDAIGNPAWSKDPKFGDAYGRWRNQEELDKLVSAWTVDHRHYEVAEVLQRAGIAAVPCLTQEERLFDHHFHERSTYTQIDHPAVGAEWLTSPVWKFSRTPCHIYRPAPLLGEHNQYVLVDLLGMSQSEIDALVDAKVIY